MSGAVRRRPRPPAETTTRTFDNGAREVGEPGGSTVLALVFVLVAVALIGVVSILPTWKTLDATTVAPGLWITSASNPRAPPRRPSPPTAPATPTPTSLGPTGPSAASLLVQQVVLQTVAAYTATTTTPLADACLGDESGQTRLLFAGADGFSAVTPTGLAVFERGRWADMATGASAIGLVFSSATPARLLPMTRCGGDVSSTAYDRVSDPHVVLVGARRLVLVARGVRLPSLVDGRLVQTEALLSMTTPTLDGTSGWPLAPTPIAATLARGMERVESLVAADDHTALLLTSAATELHLWRYHADTDQWDATPLVLASALPATRALVGQGRAAALVAATLPNAPATWYAGYQTDSGTWTAAAESRNGGLSWTAPLAIPRGFPAFRPNAAIATNAPDAGAYALWETSAFDLANALPNAPDLGAWTRVPAPPGVPVNRTARLVPGLGAPRVARAAEAGLATGLLYAVGADASALVPTARTLLVSQRTCSHADVRATCQATTVSVDGCTPDPAALGSACRRVPAPWDQATLVASASDGAVPVPSLGPVLVDPAIVAAGGQTVATALAVVGQGRLVVVVYEALLALANTTTTSTGTLKLAAFDGATLTRLAETTVVSRYEIGRSARIAGGALTGLLATSLAVASTSAPSSAGIVTVDMWLAHLRPAGDADSVPESAVSVPSNAGIVVDPALRGRAALTRLRATMTLVP